MEAGSALPFFLLFPYTPRTIRNCIFLLFQNFSNRLYLKDSQELPLLPVMRKAAYFRSAFVHTLVWHDVALPEFQVEFIP